MNATLETNKNEFYPGETLNGRIRLKIKNPLEVRAIVATFYCHEKKKTMGYVPITIDEKRRIEELGMVVTSPVKMVETFSENDIYKMEKKIAPKGKYSLERFDFFFEIPKTAQPTSYDFGHDNKKIIWKIKVKLDIPLAPDINIEKEIKVLGL